MEQKKPELYLSQRIYQVPIERIIPNPRQPRRHFDEQSLRELAASIRQHGILQPLSVQRAPGGYVLVAGERRLRAAGIAGLTRVPCILVRASAQDSAMLALIENLQRCDLHYMEEAAAIAKLISSFGLSQEEAARRLGRSQSAVANKLRLLKLSPRLLDRLRQNGLTERHARALLRLETEEQQWEVLEYVIDHHLTVAQTEAYIEARLTPPPPRKKKPTFILKDVRLFLNTVTKGLSMMKDAGVNAEYGRQETEDAILLTIKIPKAAS